MECYHHPAEGREHSNVTSNGIVELKGSCVSRGIEGTGSSCEGASQWGRFAEDEKVVSLE
jgi:hypothetical protein